MGVTDIIKGHINEIFDKNQELSDDRFKICYECPLYIKKSYGEACNDDLYLNPNTNEVLYYPKNGFYKGCGCRLSAKTTLPTAHCPANKW